jgi:GPH family glycoside/pentoside/hexuronide:cation symporter
MLGDVCDEDELKTGRRREGIYSASLEFGKKAAIAVATLLTGYALAFTGFNQKLAVQTDQTLVALRGGYVVLMVGTLLVSAICIWFYPLSHESVNQVRRLLESRRERV